MLYDNPDDIDSMVIGGASGALVAHLLNANVIIPILTTLFIPFMARLGSKVVIPWIQQKLKIKEDESE